MAPAEGEAGFTREQEASAENRIPPSPYCMFGGRVASGTFVDRLGDSNRALADQREEQAP